MNRIRPPKATVGTDGLIDNVLYKPADIVRRGPNEYELDQDSSQNPTQYGLVDQCFIQTGQKYPKEIRINTNTIKVQRMIPLTMDS